ncbi:MAG TPA: cysteine desulfurase CsdA [Parachlamydiales bacterium]|nr:MAG: cysteine sulfinate desulfinase [Chlamydiae bacterium GWA2_50_15]OGN55491.1 MAG: cysteine sulfinate desulfinase [Chlamydiae bacterium GWF2_49_8]OGN57497.1 MAG: cysteine sulfinate desulfinase [Chlamydiae bacterium RIFCSPHIGHO2_02_FULL_49_29]OGN71104.1 MAG: cysteine sulfinate desulfinase [Chlamydiae bacterium RIFCSPLOWO2_02_FULL_49_12]OGN73371.1 MAG: cysteine sulfinate desulfinase [Chlamydiae bacterium RIFCSPLOWO2_12_FULL_49_12]HAZ15988.1 cysteine desulfurase CsdA [Parachlamydiales bacter
MIEEKKSLDVARVRSHFPMLKKTMHGKPLIYLDSAATALKPQVVIDAVQRYYTEEFGTVHRAVYELAGKATERYESVRKQVGQFLNAASSEEIIFTKGTTDAINLVAQTYGKAFVQAGDEIILSVLEHHSNIVPWQLLAKENGAVLKVIPCDERGVLLLDEYDGLLSERTKLVSVAHISNSLGTLHPVKEIILRAHARGVPVFIDGAQAVPHMEVDVQELDADFYAFSGHKAFGPTGVGVLYGKRKMLEKLPPYQGGGDMIERVFFEESTFQKPPLRFEAGTPPIAQVMGLGAALSFIESIGRGRIAAWEKALLEYATEKLLQIDGLSIVGTAPEKGAILSFVVKEIHPLDLGTLLDLKGVAVRTGHHCAQPALRRFSLPATTRASFAPYTTFEEIDNFIAALKEAILLLSPSLSY